MTVIDPERVESVARGLTKASRRALVRIAPDGYISEGGAGPSRSDAYSLWWGRDGKHKLVKEPIGFDFTFASCRWKYALTPLGLAVRDYLRTHPANEESGHELR